MIHLRFLWRLLSIRFDGLGFLAKVIRVPDLLVRQKLVTDGLNKVRSLLEEEYPLGTEVYRDENGSIFIVPDMNVLDLEDKNKDNLSKLILRAFNNGTLEKNANKALVSISGEIVPFRKLDDDPWKWENPVENATFQQIIDKHNKPLPVALHVWETHYLQADSSAVKSWWQAYSEDICTVCQLRPQGWASDNRVHLTLRRKALEHKVCTICEQRREDNAKEWADSLNKTIWLDEVAGSDGRLALVVGQFELEQWLTGMMLFYPQNCEDEKRVLETALRVKKFGHKLIDGNLIKIEGKEYIWREKTELLVINTLERPHRFTRNNLSIDGSNMKIYVEDIFLLPSGQYKIMLDKNYPELATNKIYRIFGQEFRALDNGSSIETVNEDARLKIEQILLTFRSLKLEKSFVLPLLETPPAQIIEAQAPARLFRVWETTRSLWSTVKRSL